MTLPVPGITAPRRGRPPARNEILRGDLPGGLDPADLAARYGTPLYLYDLDVIERQVGALRAKGISGFLYWKALQPVHRRVFRALAVHRIKRAGDTSLG